MTGYLDLLLSRQSVPARALREPGPDRRQIEQILSVGLRVPDHGRLVPWRFVCIQGDARRRLGQAVAEIFQEKNPGAPERQIDAERGRFSHAPVVIAVVSCVRNHPKIREWEQVLSAGACCLNILHAATAIGFAAQWVTGWCAYDADVKRILDLGNGERIAGFIHIGSASERPAERARPDLTAVTTDWNPDDDRP